MLKKNVLTVIIYYILVIVLTYNLHLFIGAKEGGAAKLAYPSMVLGLDLLFYERVKRYIGIIWRFSKHLFYKNKLLKELCVGTFFGTPEVCSSVPSFQIILFGTFLFKSLIIKHYN